MNRLLVRTTHLQRSIKAKINVNDLLTVECLNRYITYLATRANLSVLGSFFNTNGNRLDTTIKLLFT